MAWARRTKEYDPDARTNERGRKFIVCEIDDDGVQVEKQQDSIKQLEQLLTDQRMVQEGGITDSRENFALVCAQNFGFAQGGRAAG